MRTDKELHDEAMAGERSRLGTEDIANANPRVDPDARSDDMTVTGTRVDGVADQDMRDDGMTDQDTRDGDTTDLDTRDNGMTDQDTPNGYTTDQDMRDNGMTDQDTPNGDTAHQDMRDNGMTDQDMRNGDTADLDVRDDDTRDDVSDLDTRDEHAMTERAPEEDIPSTTELFPRQEVERFRVEWQEIQTRFVDDPRDSVQNADRLVAEVMRSLATTFTSHKQDLESSWQRGDQVETEDLRRALQHYRSFFNQLLEV